MPIARTERLVNLVICLLSTRQFLPASRIRAIVEGYDGGTGEQGKEAFQRMFERDKNDLRELGVPLETGTSSGWDTDTDVGYRIARRDYELPELQLDPEEAAAVGLAARLWQSGLSRQAGSAVVKLRAAGVAVDTGAALPVEPVVDAGDPALGPLLEALQTHRAVRFDYRRPDAQSPQQTREVEPWGVVSSQGRWYLVGHDRNRDGTRVFRLSRVIGSLVPFGPADAVRIPPGLDLPAMVSTAEDHPDRQATVRTAAGAAAGLRRRATAVEPGPPGTDLLTVPFGSVDGLAELLTGYGPDVLVVQPADLREAVVARLTELAGTGSSA